MSVSRRVFLQNGLKSAAAGAMLSPWLQTFAMAKPGTSNETRPNALVVIELTGGNDSLNTVIPFRDSAYFAARPTLAISRQDALPLSDTVALHPSLSHLHRLYRDGSLAIVQGVGCEGSSRSHHEAQRVWHNVFLSGGTETGWLGRYVDDTPSLADNPFSGIGIGMGVSGALHRRTGAPLSIDNVDFLGMVSDGGRLWPVESPHAFIRQRETQAEEEGIPFTGPMCHSALATFKEAGRIRDAARRAPTSADYPADNRLAQDLQQAARLLSAGLGTRVLAVSTGGFDTHTDQLVTHGRRLAELDAAIGAFYDDLKAREMADRVLVLVTSEFGRRLHENGAGGTEHGTSGPVFLLGGRVQGGIYGTPPTLSDHRTGDLTVTTDYRRVYSTLLASWLGGNPDRILNGHFDPLPLIRAEKPAVPIRRWRIRSQA